MRKLITYYSSNMSIAAEKLKESAIDKDIDVITLYDSQSLGDDFKMMAYNILKYSRGAGYWVWKPYIILKELFKANEDDLIIYSDAGILINYSIDYLLREMDQDIFLFSNTHLHHKWIKTEVRQLFQRNDNDTLEQVQASFIILRNNEFTRMFIREWLSISLIPGMIDDSVNMAIQHKDFIENRHDQAILTELAIKYNIKLHWWSTQYSARKPKQFMDKYPPKMLLHHRKRNNEYNI